MESTQYIAALSALAHDGRLEIYRLLVQAGPAGLTVGEIGDALAMPGATLSFHLSQLKHAGLVAARRDGRRLIQTANFERMNALVAYLTENCCGGQACAPVCEPACAPAASVPRRAQKRARA
ncbi:MAG: helix-turn-helix transcriptional regulator [Rhodospirillaceae bacterium]|nr:helix-turn-helix transcriptional regulator [Rhodospirillaceae bacterium]